MLEALIPIIDRLIQLKDYRDKRLLESYNALLVPIFDDLLLVHRDYLQLFDAAIRSLPDLSSTVIQADGEPVVFPTIRDANRYIELKQLKGVSTKRAHDKVRYHLTQTFPSGESVTIGFHNMMSSHRYADANAIDYEMIIDDLPRYPLTDDERSRLKRARDEIREARLALEPVRIKLMSLTRQLDTIELGREAKGFTDAVIRYFPQRIPQSNSTDASTLLAVLERACDCDTREDARHFTGYAWQIVSEFAHQHRESWSQVCEAFAALKIAVVGRK